MTDQLARVANEDLDEIPLGRGQPHLAGGSYRANGGQPLGRVSLPLREGDLRLNQVMIPVGSQGRSRWGIAGLRRGVGSVDALRHRGGRARAWSLG